MGKRFFLFFFVLCFLLYRIGLAIWSELPSETCGTENIKTVVSPDKRWNAVVRSDYCAGSPWESWVLFVVTLSSRSNPAHHEDVFSIEGGSGAPDEVPTVSWISTNQVRIRTYHDHNTQKSAFGKIKISYVYIPVLLPKLKPTGGNTLKQAP
jgi:hypothetical protein